MRNSNEKIIGQLQEQVKQLRLNIKATRETVQNKFYDTQTKISNLAKKIETDINNIEANASLLEQEILDSQEQIADKNISFVQEVRRKAIHLASISIPVCYIFFSKENILMILFPICILVIIVDITTKLNPLLRSFYLKLFGFMLRKHEIESDKMYLNGASYVMISAILTIFFFTREIAIVALSILFISDIVAAIFGRKYGHKHFLNLPRKTWFGTITFFISATIIVFIYGMFLFHSSISYFIIGIVATAITTVNEALSNDVLKMDDNLTIPLSFGISMTIFNYFLVCVF